MDQSNHERQEEELQVLQAIYMNEFEDLRTHQQTESGSPPVVRLKLTPLESIIQKDVHAKVDLLVKYTTRYPNDPPILRLEGSKGLSNQQLVSLKKDLDAQAKDLAGEVMVLQLAQSVQAFLHKHNVPTLSFHEQMLKNMQKQKEIKDLERQKRLAKDKAQAKEFDDDVNKMVQAALQEREEALRGERKRRQQTEENQRADSVEAENGVVLSTSPPNSGRRRRNTENSESNEDIDTELRQRGRRGSFICNRIKQVVEVVNFSTKGDDRTIHCGKCIGHSFQGACMRTSLDVGNGDIVTVCEWLLRSKKGRRKASLATTGNLDFENVTKQVLSMEQELSYLSSKLQHPNLIHYHAISTQEQNETLHIRVLMDDINGYSLTECIHPPGLSIEIVKDFAKQLVNVLNHLHNKSVVHRDLQPCNIFVTKRYNVKVSGYAVLRRLSDLYSLLQEETTEQDEFADYRKLVKPGKKGDIFNLGLVILSLFQGRIATGYPVELPAGLPDDLQDFLLRCLNIEEKERWTSAQLAKHPFLIISSPTSNSNSVYAIEQANDPAEVEKEMDEEMILRTLGQLNITSKTRLMTDFEVLESLGQGGFGDVIKVRKKLDGLLYAIKRINLNPKSAQLKKRIIREVKLLSRLNHENVVRYYSSWIEAEEITKEENSASESQSQTTGSSRRRTMSNSQKNCAENTEDSLLKYNNFEAPSMMKDLDENEISWCDDEVEESSKIGNHSDSDSSSDDDYDSDCNRNKCHGHASMFVQKKADTTESSEGIVFAMDDSIFQIGESDTEDESDSEQLPSQETSVTTASEATIAQYLYIQMEYCEKSTLRNVIDEGLYKSPDRMWRLFREIVEGLSHVHSQGIIHRDLKPFNIFMDSRDQVKIGDFGLATSHTTNHQIDHSLVSLSIASDGKMSTDSSNRMTGKVGTALYVAPEIDNMGEKVKISEKVDMYSLGVIFFEMCYKPLPTGMERVKVIGLLRTEKIILPEDFEEKPRPIEKKLLYWLLNHIPDERPTAAELLESGLVPPKLEDRHFDELLALTLKQPSSTRYKRLTAALFSQRPDPVTEQIYDMHLEKRQESILLTSHAFEHVEQVLRNIFTRHGAIHLDTPLLMPKSRIFEKQDSIARIMNHEGIILSLPFDSRVSLARYVSRNNIRNIKRYSTCHVYRDTKINRTHPKEIKECSFDIISDSTNSMIPDAEVLYAVEEIIKHFSFLKHRNFYVRVNHTSLLKAILLQANLNEAQVNKVYEMLQSSKDSKDCSHEVKKYLSEEGVAEHNMTKLLSALDIEGPVNKAREHLQSLRKSRGLVGSLAKQGLSDLLTFAKNAQSFGLEMPICVQTSLAYNLNILSGITFQIVAESKRRKKHGVDILAAGGRYDNLLEMFRRSGEQKHAPHGVGISIAVEKIVNALLLDLEEDETILSDLSDCDVLVGVMGESTQPEQRLSVVRDLWLQGIRAMLSSYDIHQDCTPELLQDICKESGINHLVLLKASEVDYVRVRSREKEKFNEMKLPRNMMCEYLLSKLSGRSEVKDVDPSMQRVASVPQMQATDTQLINMTFILQDKSIKRRVESQCQSKLSNTIQQSFLKTPVEVVVVDLPPTALKNLFAHLDIDAEEEEFEASVLDIIDKQKLKKVALYIHRICTTLREIKRERNVVLLYGCKEDFYRIFI